MPRASQTRARARAQVMSGQLVAPNVPTAAETLEMQRLVDTYGKTFHTWQVDRGDQLPLGVRAPLQAAPRPPTLADPRRGAAVRQVGRDGVLPAAARQRYERAPRIKRSQSILVAHECIAYGVETGFPLLMSGAVLFLNEPGAARIGPPQLMMAFTGDGQLNPAILAARDERLGARGL